MLRKVGTRCRTSRAEAMTSAVRMVLAGGSDELGSPNVTLNEYVSCSQTSTVQQVPCADHGSRNLCQPIVHGVSLVLGHRSLPTIRTSSGYRGALIAGPRGIGLLSRGPSLITPGTAGAWGVGPAVGIGKPGNSTVGCMNAKWRASAL